MKTIKIDKYYRGMIAHRGLSGIETENTVFSFLAAANHSYYGISCDLYTSKDGRMILTSDTTLLKFGLLNLDIQSFDYEELMKFALVDRKTQNLNSYLFIPLLKDFLSIVKAYEKKPIIRLHFSLKKENISRLLRNLSDFDLLNDVILITESQKQVDILLDYIESNQIYYDHIDLNQSHYEFCNKHKVNVYLDKKIIDQNYVKKCHLIGLSVMTGVVNDKDLAEKMIKLDIDYILTNILE